MTGIDCAKCGAHVTVRGLRWCPICRAPMKPLPSNAEIAHAAAKPIHAAHIRPVPEPRKSPARYKYTVRDWIAIICVPAILICIGLIAYRAFVPSDSQRHDRAISEALQLCQRAITSIAEYGAADTPPYTQNYGKQDEFYFAWPKGSFEFTNGFGARVKMSASCIGKVSTGEITSLTVNGKDFR